MIQPLIPKVAAVVKHLVSSDETKQALKFMEIFEKWLYRGIPILWDHLEVITDIFMVTALRKDLDDAIRVKALHFLSAMAEFEKEATINNELVTPILQTLFDVMTEENEEDNEIKLNNVISTIHNTSTQ